MRLCELRQKEVINICSCSSLGCVIDVEIDIKNGCVISLIVPGPGRLPSLFGRDNELIIPWKCICQIGEDIILVKIQEENCHSHKK